MLAIDPGPDKSGWVLWDGTVVDSGHADNHDVRHWLRHDTRIRSVAIETMQANYAATVGHDVIRTLIWIGRFVEAWPELVGPVRLISRQEVKAAVCNNVKANDAGVRQALIDRLGPPGTKKAPGATYGVTGHAWSALAVAVAASMKEATHVEG